MDSEFEKHKKSFGWLTRTRQEIIGQNLIYTKKIETDHISAELLNKIYRDLDSIIRNNFANREFYLKIRVGKYLKKSEGSTTSYRTFYSSHNTEVNPLLISANIDNYKQKIAARCDFNSENLKQGPSGDNSRTQFVAYSNIDFVLRPKQ